MPILKELINLVEERPAKKEKVKVNPMDWRSVVRGKTSGIGTVIGHEGSTGVVIKLDDTGDVITAFDGEYEALKDRDRKQAEDDALEWREKMQVRHRDKIRYHEAIELGKDPGADELYEELEELLEDAKDDLLHHAGPGTSYSIGGNLHAHSSGLVKLVKNFRQHHSYSGLSTEWDLCLQVGNNIKGRDALQEVTRIFKEAETAAKHFQTSKFEKFNSVFHAYFDDGSSVSCKYDYGSAFSWIAIRKDSK